MSNPEPSIVEIALALSAPERLALADLLLQSLEDFDREIDADWAEEAELRLLAGESAELEGVPASAPRFEHR